MKDIGLVLYKLSSEQVQGWSNYGKRLGIEHLFFSREECFLDEYILVEKNCRLFYDLKLFLENCRRGQICSGSIVEPEKNMGSPLLLLESGFSCAIKEQRLDKRYRDGYRKVGISYGKKESSPGGELIFFPQVGRRDFLDFFKQRPALFLDRDGVINRDKNYVYRWRDVEFCPGIVEFIKAARQKGYLVFVVTNQSGVGRGFYKEDDVVLLHRQMDRYLREEGAEITKWFFCPWYREGKGDYRKISIWRKPQAGMILQAEREFSIDRLSSLMVGDKPSDQIRLQGLESLLIQKKSDFEDICFFKLKEMPGTTEN